MAVFIIESFLLFVLLVLLIVLYITYKYRRKYTRERFAFILLSNYFSAFVLFIQYLLSPNFIYDAINYVLINYLNQPEIHFDEPSFAEEVLALTALIVFIYSTYKLFKNWNGGKSVRENENKYISKYYILPEAYSFLAHKESNILAHDNTVVTDEEMLFEQMEVEKHVWRIQAAELLMLKDTQYKIDIENDWHSEYNCYISNYGVNGQVIAILCSHQLLVDADISTFLIFAQQHKKGAEDIRYIWAIQEEVSFNKKSIEGYSIEVVTESKLLEELIDFSDYKRDLIKRFEHEMIYEGNPLTLRDVYVEPKCRVYDLEKKEHSSIPFIEKYIENWLNDDQQHKQLALLGEYGQGKSVLSLRLAYQIMNGQIESKRIPIIIELRGRYLETYHTDEILYTWAYRYNIFPKALLKLHYAGKLLLIFEGFDELVLIGDKQTRKDHFRNLWKYSIPKSKIIITGRPNYFIDDQEMTTLLRLSQKQPDGSKYCETINLLPFNREQIIDAMRSLKPDVRNEIIRVYDQQSENSSFRDLVSRPSLLFLTGLIWEKENLALRISNINSAKVIKTFLEYSYKRQDEKEVESIMNSDERAYFMQGIAISMVSRHGYTNQIESNELDIIIENLFRTFPEEITSISSSADKIKLQNRRDNKNLLLHAIKTDIRSCGVLVKDLSKENTFCFAHKSFLEVLIADFITHGVLMKKNTTNNINKIKVIAMSNSLNLDLTDFYVEENVFKFVVELLSSEIHIKEKEENPKKYVNIIYRQLHLYPFSLKCLGWLNAFSMGSIYRNINDLMILMYVISCPIVFLLLFLIGPHHEFSFEKFFLFILLSVILIVEIVLLNVFKANKNIKSRQSILSQSIYKTNLLFEKIINHLSTSENEYQENNRDLTRISNLKVVLFYQVCRNLHVENALKQIWPSFVYKNVERLAKRWMEIKDSPASI